MKCKFIGYPKETKGFISTLLRKKVFVSRHVEAMKSEMNSMFEKQVWTLVEPNEGIRSIGCKWVFKRQTDMEGNVKIYKFRLVAKGYTQKQCFHFYGTFSPVAMVKSIRILLSIVVYYEYEMWKIDVKIAFLK